MAVLPLWGHFATSGDIFDCHNSGRGVLLVSSGVDVRDNAKHHTLPKRAPTMRNYPDQNVYSVKVKKPLSMILKVSLFLTGHFSSSDSAICPLSAGLAMPYLPNQSHY